MNYIIFLLLIIVIIFLLLELPKFRKKINGNLQLAAVILNGTIKNKFFGYEKIIEGLYKERKILFSYDYLAKFNRVSAIIIPRNIIEEHQKSFENWTKDNIIELLEELTTASENVETNRSFYKN